MMRALVVLALSAAPPQAQAPGRTSLAITGVTVIDVATGSRTANQTVMVDALLAEAERLAARN